MKTKHSDKIIVFDTTLRDGEQAPGCHLNGTQKLAVARQLHKLGVDVIEAGFPVSSREEFEAVKAIAQTVGRDENAPEICGLARAVPSDIQACWDAVKAAKRPRIHLFLATSDIHLEKKLRMSREDALKKAVEGVRAAKKYTDNVQFAAEDAFRSDWDYLCRVIEAVIEAGASTVNIPDTVGYAIPEEFAELIRTIRARVRNIDQAVISVHCHDDLGMSVANTLAAVKAGARQIECTVNGIGERAGNCSLEEAVMAIRTRRDFFGLETDIRTPEILNTSRKVSEEMGVPVAPHKAIVGANAFRHGSGVHQDGMLKASRTYEILRPEEVGAESSQIILTARSGRKALESRFEKLGYRFSREQMALLFLKFKDIAERKKIVLDADLQTLVTV